MLILGLRLLVDCGMGLVAMEGRGKERKTSFW